MVERAKELNANLGKEDVQFILEHQAEIPQEYQWKFHLVFTAWRDPSDPRYGACFYWGGSHWYQSWYWLDRYWCENDRLVRRRT